jgi:hypothetical protein
MGSSAHGTDERAAEPAVAGDRGLPDSRAALRDGPGGAQRRRIRAADAGLAGARGDCRVDRVHDVRLCRARPPPGAAAGRRPAGHHGGDDRQPLGGGSQRARGGPADPGRGLARRPGHRLGGGRWPALGHRRRARHGRHRPDRPGALRPGRLHRHGPDGAGRHRRRLPGRHRPEVPAAPGTGHPDGGDHPGAGAAGPGHPRLRAAGARPGQAAWRGAGRGGRRAGPAGR